MAKKKKTGEPGFKLSPDFAEALSFTAQLHADHRRSKSQVPYLAHLLSVCSLVLEHDGTEDEAIAALLHDSLEDQAVHLGGAEQLRKRIRRRFGERVVEIVDGCTDAVTHPKPEWEGRKQRYIEAIETATESVCLVIAADKLHNARSILDDLYEIGNEVWEKFKPTRERSLWYYRSVTEALKPRLPQRGKHLVQELDRVVTQLEEWK